MGSKVLPAGTFRLPWDKITKHAAICEIPAALVAAIILAESSGNPMAARFESGYKWLKDPKKFAKKHGISAETEERLQQFSYGLMQIMGATARDLGYEGSLGQLYDVDMNLNWGCQFIGRLFERYFEVKNVIAAYNAGSPVFVDKARTIYKNQAYVDKVFGYYVTIKDMA